MPADHVAAPLRVVYFGTPQFAVPTLERLLASRHTVVGVVTQPDRARGRGQKISDGPVKALALAHGLPVIQPEKLRAPDVEATLRAWRPDIGVVAAYGRLIPDALLAVPRLGMINVHASLLPAYRGAAPVHRSVIDGMAETGVTIMRVGTELDAGAMFARVVRPIGPDDTSDVLEGDLSQLGGDLLLTVLDRIANGTAHEEPQDAAGVTYASKITRDDSPIDWTQPAASIHNRVRGLYPWPHASTHLDGQRMIIRTTALDPGATAAEPGTIVAVTRDAIVVATGRGQQLAVLEVQPEGRRAMRVRDFLAGRPLRPGQRFGAA
jgi:methionyl-tRNA formyltransferase